MQMTTTTINTAELGRSVADWFMREKPYLVRSGDIDGPVAVYRGKDLDDVQTFAEAYRERLRQLVREADGHGPCCCAACYAAGRPSPRRDWVLLHVEGTNNRSYPYRVTGMNLNFPPEERRPFRSGWFTWAIPRLSDPRYDASHATFTDMALAWMAALNERVDIDR